MKKKKTLLICALIFLVIVGSFIYIKIDKIEENYQKAVKYYEEGKYETAEYILTDIPKRYKERDDIYSKLNTYNGIYMSAISLLEDADYNGAVEKLKELPDNYKSKNLIINNIDKIEYLVENDWYNNSTGYGWYYEDHFILSDFSNDLALFYYENEYLNGELINDYSDIIEIDDLLDDGKVYVESNQRDSYYLDINGLETGEYTVSTDYVKSTYKIKGNA